MTFDVVHLYIIIISLAGYTDVTGNLKPIVDHLTHDHAALRV